MFTQIDFTKAAGKTIRSVVKASDEVVLVSFTDGTFSQIESSRCWDDSEIDTYGEFVARDHRTDLVLSPLLGDEAADEMHQASVAEEQQRLQKWELTRNAKRRAEYELMKQEFGNQ